MRAIRFLSALVMFTTLAAIACSAIGAEPVDFGKLWGKPEIKSGKAEILPGGQAPGGAAAMLLDFSAEPTDGALGRALLTDSDRKITVSARVKVAGQVKIASLAVNMIGGQGGSQPIVVANGPGDWQSGNRTVSVPADVGMIFLNLTFEGQGKVWLADLKIEGRSTRPSMVCSTRLPCRSAMRSDRFRITSR